ncbi:MAG: MFS transporter [Chloroflexi bacterium]|nr:MFS transporter [Chloroflexota bacterium]
MKKIRSSPLLPIFLIVFIGLLGFGIILPLLPLYAEVFGASPFMVGVLLASYSLMQLIATPYLGALSDRIGRRPVLVISQIGTVLSFILLGLANSLPLLFIARLLDGISGGNISTAQAYISDVVEEKDRAKAYGLIGAAFGLGFIMGPALGGILSQGDNYHIPAYVAAAISLVSLLLTIFMLPESLPREKRNTLRQPRIIDVEGLRRAFSYEQLGLLLLIFFLFNLSQAGFQGLFALFNDRQFGFGAQETGYVLAYVGVLAVLIQGGGIGPIVRRFGERHALQFGLALGGIGLVLAGFATSWPLLLLALTPVALGLGVATPSANSLITRESPPAERGQILGISQSVAALARVVGPLVAGLAFEYETWGPFVMSGILIIVAFGFALRLLPPTRPSEDPRFRTVQPGEERAAS